ncbi:bifunctional metallophosphatase/5'-nucleotidase [Levilactobacillus brevis]|uniref:Multifunctional 2',3'-cyclic-nucleotide 2'-phosphodiesterase/5'-nucleotidase/3'-nucleotidase n=1 Tax=Levilactobacillus brevis TaxID=1580 RepID=A0AAJ5K8A4_LEVBR|nr:bifunctional metallophosphatase/5'-nucleotidase [Levilactobacillus brevis]TYA97548.1 bifunctional metallophosphatase/5'-nucleotidase [Lactobacillus sp. SL9-6]AWP46281.1 multifunctional 2',3'-cyclic-nucleotide 2'-phosphodiesterase/5'-nucleotidase/3'-nucleotidase [Levilactobacillus brevis]RAY09516.1 bifunctional metallophosphatase/5'-nucleotidase [Levilactobacillus brevis]TOY84258.1 multifunctional 2',3'-cyclic-nucleotide 2'-phosphodiesterase/5'-nucleotidase/3'-nucleotidase [Levilactobacillus 
MMERITILHTNDLHSHFENWPRIRRYLKTTRQQVMADGATVYTFDLGDHVDRVHPVSEATNGQQNIQLMNQIGYDGVTIGNNEGLGFVRAQLDHLYDHANFPVILGNLRIPDTHELPDWAIDHRLLTTAAGTRLLVLGLTAPYHLTYPLAGWQILDVQPTLAALLHRFAGQFDVCVLLSHLGLDVDRLLAKRFPQVTVIIGSHTHHLLPHGEHDHQSLLAAAGKFGRYIGKIELSITADHQVKSAVASVTETATLPVADGDTAEITGLQDLGESILSEQRVANLPTAMEADPTGQPRLVREGLHAIAEYAGTQAAILNAGLFLQDLPSGVVNQNQLHQLLPHNMHVMTVTLSGYDLWRLVQEFELARLFLRRFPQKGMGFRGKIFGELNYLGLAYDAVTHQVTWRGEPLSPTRQYRIAMVDHYLFIPFFPTISIVGKNQILYDDLLREVFAQYLARHYPLT